MSKTFGILIDGYYELSVRDVWPDGDEPEHPTAVDVADVMRAAGAPFQVVRDWGLQYEVTVDGLTVWPA